VNQWIFEVLNSFANNIDKRESDEEVLKYKSIITEVFNKLGDEVPPSSPMKNTLRNSLKEMNSTPT